GLIVAEAVRDELGLTRADHLLCVQVNVRLDAAPRNRAADLAALGDDEFRADRPWCRAAARDHSGDGDLLTARPQPGDVLDDVLHAACLLSMPESVSASSSSAARL